MARRARRRTELAALLVAGILVPACSDSEKPTGPAPVEGALGAAIWCEASPRQNELSCSTKPGATGGSGEPTPGSVATLGGQDEYVRLAAEGAAYDSIAGVFRAGVSVRNLLAQVLGSPDGFTVTGLQVFVHSGPEATAGSGAVAVRNADGTATFEQRERPYFSYAEIVDPGERSAASDWEWTVAPGVQSFGFEVYVRAHAGGGAPVAPATGFELRGGTSWTTHEEELAFLSTVASVSPRMTHTTVGTSVNGRPIHFVRVGYPAPPPDSAIAAGRNVLIIATQHGNEPAGREMALTLLRDLAFTRDSVLLEQLHGTTVLFIPTANPDGRQANTRGNTNGTDTNRDHLRLATPEGQTMARTLRDFSPDIVIDAHERPNGNNPEMELLWGRNLNAYDPVRELSIELVQDYVWPDLVAAGFSVGLYAPNPGAPGDENENTLRNASSLRHSLAMLTETAGQRPGPERVQAQLVAAHTMLRFHRERMQDIVSAVAAAPIHKAAAGALQSEPFYLFGADNDPPSADQIMDPPPCGYLINYLQAQNIVPTLELYPVQTETVSATGVFVTMAQPLMTVVPLLFDGRARSYVMEGLPLYEPAECADPSAITPPALPTPPGQFATDFSDGLLWHAPADWSVRWRDSDWTILDEPRRLRHYVGSTGGRRAMTWDAVGDAGHVQGDVEIFAIVRVQEPMPQTRFQFMLHVSGNAGSERAYYMDTRANGDLRVNLYRNGTFVAIASARLPFTVTADTWYRVVLQRQGDALRAKVWPDGTTEPDEWVVETSHTLFDGGRVGFGHFDAGTVNDWAFFSIGTGGQPAPRAPPGLLTSGN